MPFEILINLGSAIGNDLEATYVNQQKKSCRKYFNLTVVSDSSKKDDTNILNLSAHSFSFIMAVDSQ